MLKLVHPIEFIVLLILKLRRLSGALARQASYPRREVQQGNNTARLSLIKICHFY